MASCSRPSIILTRPFNDDIVHYLLEERGVAAEVSIDYLVGRFGVTKIYSVVCTGDGNSLPFTYGDFNFLHVSLLKGQSYNVHCDDNPFPISAKPQRSTQSVTIFSDSTIGGSCGDVGVTEPPLPFSEVEDPSSTVVHKVSAMDQILHVKVHSEISKFIQNFIKENRHPIQVTCLPSSYNGDVVFELPPVSGGAGKGMGLQDMDRDNDCYAWSRLVKTSANIAKKKVSTFTKVSCVCSLECRFQNCEFFL